MNNYPFVDESMHTRMNMYVCVSVCVCERERERERKSMFLLSDRWVK